MPSPRPIKRQFARSVGVPCARRGYHSNGTLTVRPSTRSTTRVSSVTVIRWASAERGSLGKVLIPSPAKLIGVVHHQRLHTSNLGPTNRSRPAAPDQARAWPDSRPAPHARVAAPPCLRSRRTEEQPIRSAPEDRRHGDDCMPRSPGETSPCLATCALSGRGEQREPRSVVAWCYASRCTPGPLANRS